MSPRPTHAGPYVPTCEFCHALRPDARQRIPGDRNCAVVCDDCEADMGTHSCRSCGLDTLDADYPLCTDCGGDSPLA